MTPNVALATPLYMIPPFPVRRFTVDEYHRMIQAGILTENDPVELLEGWITPKMPHNPPHDSVIDRTNVALLRRLLNGWRIRVQSSITTPDSEPEPDIVVAVASADWYSTRHPGPADIALLVEVADSTISHDRNQKARLYAAANIQIYWIINIVDRQVEVYSAPSGPGPAPSYAQRQDYGLQDSVPLLIAGQVVAHVPVADLLA